MVGSTGTAARVDPGLCASCAHLRTITSSRGSVFYLCQLSSTDARFPRYPTLPILSCRGYEPVRERDQGTTTAAS